MATKKTAPVSGQKIRITLKSFDHRLIDDASKIIFETAERTGAIVSGPIPLPVKIKKITLNKSTFVHKDAREQYEIRRHKRILDVMEATPMTIESLSNLHIPAGVDVSIKMIAMTTAA